MNSNLVLIEEAGHPRGLPKLLSGRFEVEALPSFESGKAMAQSMNFAGCEEIEVIKFNQRSIQSSKQSVYEQRPRDRWGICKWFAEFLGDACIGL